MLPNNRAVTLAAPPARALPGDVLLPAAVLFLLAVFVAAGGWLSGLGGYGDPDSALRLVSVREFLAGRGWYDLLEPRLGPPPGVALPWPRLLDLPVAGLILAFDPLVGRPAAEILAVDIWPPVAFVLFGWGVVATVLRFADGVAAAVALVLVVLSPAVLTVFAPGRIGVDGVQAVLLAWMLAGLVRADGSARAAAAAGALAALGFAIGPGMHAPVLLATAALAAAWVRDGDRWRRAVAAYGTALAATTAVFFVVCVDPARWTETACGRFSTVHLALAGIGGLAAALLARVLRGGPADGAAGYLLRGAGVAGVGSAMVTVTALAFPDCLAVPGTRPGADLPGAVGADGLTALVRAAPWRLTVLWAGPVVALVLAGAAAVAARGTRSAFGFALLVTGIAGALGFSLREPGGLLAAGVLAAVAAASASTALARDGLGPRHPAAPLLRSTWVLAAPMLWSVAGDLPGDGTAARLRAAAAMTTADCLATVGETIAALPPGPVVAPAGYGPAILVRTAASVLAAPYVWNAEGLRIADAILAADDGRRPFDAAGARYVALCPGEAETSALARRAPHGLAARLAAGERPGWLEVVADGPAALVLRRRAEVPSTPAAPDVTGTLPPPVLRPGFDWAGQPGG